MFVAGGTGAVGRHAIVALVQQGHTVTALARTPEKAATLTAQGATAVSVSLFDRAALAAAVRRPGRGHQPGHRDPADDPLDERQGMENQ